LVFGVRPIKVQAAGSHLERTPKHAVIWFDLGLAFKTTRDWPGCIAAGLYAFREGPLANSGGGTAKNLEGRARDVVGC
jgi:hypothetical protein